MRTVTPSDDRAPRTGLRFTIPTSAMQPGPEQVLSASAERTLDARSDVYSLGAVSDEMIAGEPPSLPMLRRAGAEPGNSAWRRASHPWIFRS